MLYTYYIRPFAASYDDKDQALKVLEEAAEVVAAWKDEPKEAMVEECMDVMQAITNLLYACGISQDMVDLYCDVVRRKNVQRGRHYAVDEVLRYFDTKIPDGSHRWVDAYAGQFLR